MTQSEREVWSDAERALMVELCRYFAQYLCLVRKGYSYHDEVGQTVLPADGNIPTGTELFDFGIGAYGLALGTLSDCGFLQGPTGPLESKRLACDSMSFDVSRSFSPPLKNFLCLSLAFKGLFKTYAQNGKLGHPDTLQKIVELLPAAGLVEERYGFIEWSDKALDWAKPGRQFTVFPNEVDFLWNVDTLDWHVNEARGQWQSGL